VLTDAVGHGLLLPIFLVCGCIGYFVLLGFGISILWVGKCQCDEDKDLVEKSVCWLMVSIGCNAGDEYIVNHD
jgi:hypothetical protein